MASLASPSKPHYRFGKEKGISPTLDGQGLAEAAGVGASQVILRFDNKGSRETAASNLSHRCVWGTAVDQIPADERVHYDAGLEEFRAAADWTQTSNLRLRKLKTRFPKAQQAYGVTATAKRRGAPRGARRIDTRRHECRLSRQESPGVPHSRKSHSPPSNCRNSLCRRYRTGADSSGSDNRLRYRSAAFRRSPCW
jgi:hypothetical protein